MSAFPFLRQAVSDGKIFAVIFEKSDGSFRYMRCRLGVKKHIKGTGKGVNLNKDLMTVFDMDKKEYRSFHISKVDSVRIQGNTYFSEEF